MIRPGLRRLGLRSFGTWGVNDPVTPSIYIIHDERRYVEPLLTELTKRGTPFVEWNLESSLSKHLLDTSSIPPHGIFYNRISACGCPLHRDIPQLARGILMWLQTHRRRVVNGADSISLVSSKMETQIALQLNGINIPRSCAALNEAQVVDAARNMNGKFMIEPNRRDLGKGAQAFSLISDLESHLRSNEFIRSADNITVVQEFVKSRAPYVNRVEFVGGQLLYGMHVDATRGLDKLVPGYSMDPAHQVQDGRGSDHSPVPRYQVIPEFEHPVLEKYVAFMNKYNLDIASFEFVEDTDGNTVTFDIDICSTFNSPAEYRAKVPNAGVKAIANYLTRVLELSRPIRGAQVQRKAEEKPKTLHASPHARENVIFVDGGMGRELKKRLPDAVNEQVWSANALIHYGDLVKECHLDFIKGGARVITASNYACTPHFLGQGGMEDQVEALNEKACLIACAARDECGIEGVKVMASLPPLSVSYRTDLVGDLETMLPVYDRMAAVLSKHVDMIICETMSTPTEAYAAVKAASKYGTPVWVSFTLRDDLSGLLLSGDTIEEAYKVLKEFTGPDGPIEAFLFNCCAPESIEVALPILLGLTDKPVGAMPNCFAPIPTDWTLTGVHGFRELREDMDPLDLAGYVRGWVDKGARIVGGCCGIGPDHMLFTKRDLQEGLSVNAPLDL